VKRSLFWLLDHYPETGESIADLHRFAVQQATEADRLGFDSLWLAEHHFRALGTAPNPAVLLAAIAERTRRIRLGPAVAVLPLRDPIQIAEDYALVDALSGGRLNMGVGSGSQESEYEPFAIDFDSRRDRCARNLAIVRERWDAATRGEVGPGLLNVSPIQTPPPIYVATMNEDAAYEIGLAGDSLLTLVPPGSEGLSDPVERVRAHARGLERSAQRTEGAESVVMMFAHVAETKDEVRSTVVPALGRLMRAMTGDALPDPDAFYEGMRSGETGLFGTPPEVQDQFARLSELGAAHVALVSRFGGMTREASAASLRFMAPAPVTMPAAKSG